jgi:hypothetical protein
LPAVGREFIARLAKPQGSRLGLAATGHSGGSGVFLRASAEKMMPTRRPGYLAVFKHQAGKNSFLEKWSYVFELTVVDTLSKAKGCLVPFRSTGRQTGQAGRLCYPVLAAAPVKYPR